MHFQYLISIVKHFTFAMRSARVHIVHDEDDNVEQENDGEHDDRSDQ